MNDSFHFFPRSLHRCSPERPQMHDSMSMLPHKTVGIDSLYKRLAALISRGRSRTESPGYEVNLRYSMPDHSQFHSLESMHNHEVAEIAVFHLAQLVRPPPKPAVCRLLARMVNPLYHFFAPPPHCFIRWCAFMGILMDRIAFSFSVCQDLSLVAIPAPSPHSNLNVLSASFQLALFLLPYFPHSTNIRQLGSHN